MLSHYTELVFDRLVNGRMLSPGQGKYHIFLRQLQSCIQHTTPSRVFGEMTNQIISNTNMKDIVQVLVEMYDEKRL